MAFISTGTTLSFPVDTNSTNDVTVNLLSFNVNVSRPTVETSTMATANDGGSATNIHSATFLPGKLVSRTIEVTFDFDPTQGVSTDNQTPPALMNAVPSDAIVLTFSDSAADAWTVAGFVTDYSASSGVDERVEGSMSIQCTGIPAAGW